MLEVNMFTAEIRANSQRLFDVEVKPEQPELNLNKHTIVVTDSDMSVTDGWSFTVSVITDNSIGIIICGIARPRCCAECRLLIQIYSLPAHSCTRRKRPTIKTTKDGKR